MKIDQKLLQRIPSQNSACSILDLVYFYLRFSLILEGIRKPFEGKELAADSAEMTVLLAYMLHERCSVKLEPDKH